MPGQLDVRSRVRKTREGPFGSTREEVVLGAQRGFAVLVDGGTGCCHDVRQMGGGRQFLSEERRELREGPGPLSG